MASSERIGMAGIQLFAGEAKLIVLALTGGMVMDYVIFPVLKLVDPATSIIDPAALGFIPSLYYGLLLLLGIAFVWRAYQQVVVIADYYPGMRERNF